MSGNIDVYTQSRRWRAMWSAASVAPTARPGEATLCSLLRALLADEVRSPQPLAMQSLAVAAADVAE